MLFVETLKRLLPRARDGGSTAVATGGPVALDTSHDRVLAAFKADLAKRAEKNTRHIPGKRPSRRA